MDEILDTFITCGFLGRAVIKYKEDGLIINIQKHLNSSRVSSSILFNNIDKFISDDREYISSKVQYEGCIGEVIVRIENYTIAIYSSPNLFINGRVIYPIDINEVDD